MARHSLSTSNDGTKAMSTVCHCNVCGIEVKAADAAKWTGVPSGSTSFVYDCKGCKEPYTVTFTVP